jgi:formylglycine-generating enzyme required for sulfatase activity
VGDSGRLKNRARHRAGLAEEGQQARATHASAEVTWSNKRLFYSPTYQRNRRMQPFQKWFVAAGFLMAAVLGYLLGLSHRLPASRPGLPGKDFASSSSGKPEAELVTLKGGSYSMGDPLGELKDARPHQVTLAPFMMAKHEITLELWDSVMLWGRDHGYSDLPAGNGKGHNHPVYGISWGDAVKWCNALSEKEGLTPCYYTSTTKQNIARKGRVDIGNQHVNWEANGYRLPTEAEWEFAARGGLANKRFPLGNEITHEHANYHGSPLIEYDKSQREGTVPALMSSKPYTAAIGSFQPNGFGLHDMAGNVCEWCWDFYDPSYGTPEPQLKDPHGPDKGQNCVVRGGSWRHTAAEARCASRFSQPGDLPAAHVGFRVVRCR